MAVTKIWQIKKTVKKALDYIFDPSKTDGQLLISGYGVEADSETAAIEFELTQRQALVQGNRAGIIKAYHMIQSFSCDDHLNPEQAHQIGYEFAQSILKNEYEFCLATHIDKDQIHNHIIFNSVSKDTLKKFRCQPYKTAALLRKNSDELCRKNLLSVIINNGLEDRGKDYYEWKQARENKSYKQKIKRFIDEAIAYSDSFSAFKLYLESKNIEVKEGKRISFRIKNEEQKRYSRGDRIGKNYSYDRIVERLIDTEKTKKYERYELYRNNFEKLTEVKEVSNAILFASKENQNIDELKEKINNITNYIKTNESKIDVLRSIMKYIEVCESIDKKTPGLFNRKKSEEDKRLYIHSTNKLKAYGIDNYKKCNISALQLNLKELLQKNKAAVKERKVLMERKNKLQNAEFVMIETVERNINKEKKR